MSAWVKQNNGDYLNPVTGHWWKKEDAVWQLYEEYGQYRMITVSSDDFVEIEKKLVSSGNESRLRDQFAMAALNGYMATSSPLSDSTAEWAAIHSYEVADAMLKERDK